MGVLAHDLAEAGIARARSRERLTAEIFHNLAAVEPLWRALESGQEAFGTPYQRFDWVAAHVEAVLGRDATAQARSLRVAVLRDADGRPQALIPLLIRREYGLAVARVVGGPHANYRMPLFASRDAAAIPFEEFAQALARVGPVGGIDAYILNHQPRFWDGVPNPFAARAQVCPSDAYGLLLGPDPEATLRRVFSAGARKKLRAKARRIAALYGPIDHRIARGHEEAAAILAAFYAQKSARFARMGVSDPYSDAAIRRFLAAGAGWSAGLSAYPAIEIHALVARESGRILATFAGAVDAHRFSGMWTSFDFDAARFSPGDLLLYRLIGQQAALGRRAFDLGVGEARYKASVCDETIALTWTAIPVTLRGRLLTLGLVAAARLKGRLKRVPVLGTALRRLRHA